MVSSKMRGKITGIYTAQLNMHNSVCFSASDLVQDLSVAGQKLRQVFD